MNDPQSQSASHDAPTPPMSAAGGDTAANRNIDLSGKALGDYQILRRLGRGGMAEVYLAQQQSLRRQVALKILRSHLAEDNAYVRRFHREARAAASLVHANIVQIYEVGQADGYHYIAQEYVPGRNLRQHLQQSGTVDLPMAVSIMRQVGAALHKAAGQQIVHRDIKPENIMLTADGEVKVADFGLARIADDTESLHLTGMGVTMGTPLYMSPEQVESGEVDCRSDIYSFGVTCYHMLSGRPPFEGETAIAVALKHAKEPAKPLGEHRTDIPEPLVALIHDMLAKSPAERPQTPAEMMRRLRAMQLEGAENWSGEFDQWTGPELLALTRSSSATGELQTLMQAESRAQRKGRAGWAWWLVGIFAALVLGVGVARLNAPDDLLQFDAVHLPPIKRQATPAQQYYYAGLAPVNAERAYQSVEKYFPAEENPVNARYVRLSKMRLFDLYLEENDLTAAWQEAADLAAADPTETEARAYGIAGQILLLQRRGDQEQLAERLADLIPLASSVPDPMQDKLNDAGIDLGRGVPDG